MNPHPIGVLLQEQKLITALDLEKALAFQRQFGGRLGSILVRIGALSEDVLLAALAEQLGLTVAGGDELPTRAAEILDAARIGGLSVDWLLAQEVVL